VSGILKIVSVLLIFFCSTVFAKSKTESAGDVLHVLLPATAFASALFVERESKNSYEGAWQLIKTGFTSRLVVEGLKTSITKNRPDDSGDDAFPSGHSADTFAAATFIQQRYGWQYAVPAYLGAAYVGYSRVESDKHEAVDVLAGALIGVLSGLYFTDLYVEANKIGLSVAPVVSQKNGYGVSVSSQF